MNIMKLLKLVYLLDRRSIERRGIPVVGGSYFSLPNGPITSELLDLVNAGRLAGADDCRWEEFISDRQDHEVGLRGEAPCDHLSQSEMDLVDEIYGDFGGMDQWQIRDWTHEHCDEWTPLEQGRDSIPLERVAEAIGKNEDEIRVMREEAAEQVFMHRVFRG